LEEKGYSVQHVATGEKAIEVILKDNTPVDLILMGLDLGNGMDGTQAAEIILKEKRIPVVFLSSYIEKKIVDKTEKITSYGYVVKNSSITVLDASIKMAFKRNTQLIR
jgi:DNA-binding NarL/FixJ family response regulator